MDDGEPERGETGNRLHRQARRRGLVRHLQGSAFGVDPRRRRPKEGGRQAISLDDAQRHRIGLVRALEARLAIILYLLLGWSGVIAYDCSPSALVGQNELIA